jgi:putative peptide zinc metalloprotease protein
MSDIKLHKLRDDIVITRQIQQGDVFYVIKNPDDQSYYRFPEIQYEIIALFNGKNDFSAIKGEFEAKHPDVEIDDTTLNSFVASLKELNLLEKTAAEKNLMLLEKTRAFRKGKIIEAKGSLFYKRVPIVDPDWFFSRTINYIRFFWTKRFFVISLLSIILSYIIIALNWEKVHEGIKVIYSFTSMSFENIVLLWITVLAVIALHECGHGYTCKYFGGEVHEIGFLFLFFQPCMFCNVNDAWTFEKKSQRLLVTFGGPYFEAFIGAIATFVWWATNPATGINSICYRVLTVCGISSLAFNFNPLILATMLSVII